MQWVKQILYGNTRGGQKRTEINVLCLSDTHGLHERLEMPDGHVDVLIHAGDFTLHGKEENFKDFIKWFGNLKVEHKVVIFGNHDYNSTFSKSAVSKFQEVGVHLLKNKVITLDVKGIDVRVLGLDFCWPMKSRNPYYEQFKEKVDILVSHSPPNGRVDGGAGCPELLRLCKRVRPSLHVCGHIHYAHAVENKGGTIFVNAANAGGHGEIRYKPELVKISL